MDPAWIVFSASKPLGSVTRRLDRPWVYSWYCTEASSEPVVGTKGSSASVAPAAWNRYICILGGRPSGGVVMFALSMWLPSGIPLSVFAPSRVFSRTGSPPAAVKLPAAGVKPIGFLAR